LAIFGIATATAVLPSLSRHAAEKDVEALKDTFIYAVNFVFYITIPAMVGLIMLRVPIVALLFKRGAFSIEAAELTAQALLYYAIGLWAFSAVRIVVSTFYALQDTKTPVKMAIFAIIANIVLGRFLMVPMGHAGLALALSLSMILNLTLLVGALHARLGRIGWRSIRASLCKTVVSSLFMGAVIQLASVHLISREYASAIGLLTGLSITIITGMLFFGVCSFLFKSQELNIILSIVKKRIT
jgi:putative peptidoglycan lipid II flippase